MKLEYQVSRRTYLIKSPLVKTFQGEVVSNKIAAQITYSFVRIIIIFPNQKRKLIFF